MRPGPLSNSAGRNATAAITLAVAVAAAVGASGCSFLFSEGAPDDHARRIYFDCGTNPAPPIVDTVAAGLFGLVTFANMTSTHSFATSSSRLTAVALTGGFAALAGAAAVYGYSAVTDCRAAQRARGERWMSAMALPPPYGLPPYGAPPPVWPPPLPPGWAAPATPPPAPVAPPPPGPTAPPTPEEPSVIVPEAP